jgi:hypothetical protein
MVGSATIEIQIFCVNLPPVQADLFIVQPVRPETGAKKLN